MRMDDARKLILLSLSTIGDNDLLIGWPVRLSEQQSKRVTVLTERDAVARFGNKATGTALEEGFEVVERTSSIEP